MPEAPLTGRKAVVLGVERLSGRKTAVALAEAGADVAVVTLTEDTAADFAANSTANEFWALGRKGIALTSDGGIAAIRQAIAEAGVQLGSISLVVCNSPAPLEREALSGLRSDPAIVIIVPAEASPDEAIALLTWTRDLAASGLRANALLASSGPAAATTPVLKQHHPPSPMSLPEATVYLASDASAAIEGVMLVADE